MPEKRFTSAVVANVDRDTLSRIEAIMQLSGKSKSDVIRWALDVGLDVIIDAIQNGRINPRTGLPVAGRA